MAVSKKATSKKPVKAAKKSPRPSKGSNVVKHLEAEVVMDVLAKYDPTPKPSQIKFEPVMGTSSPIYYPFKRTATGMVYINLSMITRVDTCPSNSDLVQIGLQGQTTQLVMATLSEVMSIIGAKY